MYDYCYDDEDETMTYAEYYDNGIPMVAHYWDDEKGVKTVVEYFRDGVWKRLAFYDKDDVLLDPRTMQPSKNVIN